MICIDLAFLFFFSLVAAILFRGHEAYLRTGPQYDFEHYKQLVHEITQAFSGISKEVLEIKGRLHGEFDRADLSEHIDKLQSKEKQKLELVGNHHSFTQKIDTSTHCLNSYLCRRCLAMLLFVILP